MKCINTDFEHIRKKKFTQKYPAVWCTYIRVQIYSHIHCNMHLFYILYYYTPVWLLGDGSSVLPDGVSVSGSRLIIESAQHFHSNTYICAVSNIEGRDEADAAISVLCE